MIDLPLQIVATGRPRPSDEGSASLEFITAGLILLVPTVYLILTMSVLQSATLATEGAAREGARTFVQAGDDAAARRATRSSVLMTLADYGIDSDAATITIRCEPESTPCLERESRVTVTVDVAVTLPLAPAVIGNGPTLAIPVSSGATHTVSRFWRPE